MNSEVSWSSSVLLEALGRGSLWAACNGTICHGPSTISPFGPGIGKAAACMLKGTVICVTTGWMFERLTVGDG